MDREKALEALEQTFQQEKIVADQEFSAVLENQGEHLKTLLYEGIKGLDRNYPVQVLQFQIMRANLYQNRCQITVCGYDKSWYQDENATRREVDADFLFEPFLRLKERLAETLSVYMGAVTLYDIRNLICEAFLQKFVTMSGKVREFFYLFDEWAKAEGLEFAMPYRIVWGPYREQTETIFAMDRTGKNGADLQKECEEEEQRKRPAHFYRSFVQSTIKEFHRESDQFAFLNMKQSELELTSFINCTFVSSMFQNSKMSWCSFEGGGLFGSNLNGVCGYQMNFRNAKIENSGMEGIRLRKADFAGAKLNGVTFTGGMLEECSFKDAMLSNVDLRAKTLTGIDFTGAVLDKVYIDPKDMESLVFTSEQMEHVLVVTEYVQ